MKILIITNMYQPDFCGGAALFTDLANGLAERGHEVTVYTTFPYYPEWQDKSGRNGLRLVDDSSASTDRQPQVLRHGIFIPKNPGKLIPRIAYELSFFASLLRSALRGKKQDVVLVFCPLFGAVLFGLTRKWLRKEPMLLSVQDIPTDAATAAGINKSRLFHRLASHLQSFVFNRMDAWCSISAGMVNRLKEIKSPQVSIHFFPNWLSGPLAEAVSRFDRKIPRAAEKTIQLLYCGNIGKKQGLLDFCKLLARSPADFHFQIRGEGSAAEEVKHWIATQNDKRFCLDGFLSDDEFVDSMATLTGS